MSTLIVYASKYGCTEKCANLIAEELNEMADIVNLKKAKNCDPSAYDRVIIGGSIYMGKIQKEVTNFCTKNLDLLKDKRIGLFACGMAEGEEQAAELNANFPAELLELAVAKEFLGGEFLVDKMNFFEKAIIKKVSKITSNQSKLQEENLHKFAREMN